MYFCCALYSFCVILLYFALPYFDCKQHCNIQSISDASPPRKRTFTEEPREAAASSSKKAKKKKKRRRKDSSGSDSDPSPERKGGLQTANELLEKLAKMKEFAEKKRREKEGDFKVQRCYISGLSFQLYEWSEL